MDNFDLFNDDDNEQKVNIVNNDFNITITQKKKKGKNATIITGWDLDEKQLKKNCKSFKKGRSASIIDEKIDDQVCKAILVSGHCIDFVKSILIEKYNIDENRINIRKT